MEGRARYSSRRTRPRFPAQTPGLAPTLVQNKQLRVCHGIARENQLDNRFFIRAPVRPGRIRGEVSTAKCLVSETHRLVVSTPDSLEVVNAKDRSAGYNRTFIKSIYNVPMTYSMHRRLFLVSSSDARRGHGDCTLLDSRFESVGG